MSVKAKDFEKDASEIVWDLGSGHTQETTVPSLDYTVYKSRRLCAVRNVADAQHASTKSNGCEYYAGNTIPSVKVQIKGNRSFYFEGQPVPTPFFVDEPAIPAR